MNENKDLGYVFIIHGNKRLVKYCLTDGSIEKEYTSMLQEPIRSTGFLDQMWQKLETMGSWVDRKIFLEQAFVDFSK